MSDIKKLFVFVSAADTAGFKTAHLDQTSDSYASKIAFLAGTGEIMTQGKVFAVNKDSDISALQTLVGSTLTGTAAGSLNATTVIGFIQEVYQITQTNAGNISTNTSDIDSLENYVGDNGSAAVYYTAEDEEVIAGTKQVGDVKTAATNASGLTARVKANEDAITLLNKTDGTVGSVKKTVDDAIAAVVASAPESFDTLKEIADWIQADAQNASGFDAANRITTLETKVGNAGVKYTAEEAAAHNAALTGYVTTSDTNPDTGSNYTAEAAAAHNATLEGYVTTNDIKTASTGLYNEIDLIHGELNAMSGGAGLIQTQIENNINDLDVATVSYIATGTAAHSGTYVLSSFQIGETNGKIGDMAASYVEVEAAGAAANVQTVLLGASTDSTSTYTIHGAFNYAADLVSNKNVSASGDNNLIAASATNNAVSVSATARLSTAVSSAETAIQSVTITSTNTSYLTVTNTTGSGEGTAASASFTPVMGVAPTITGLTATKGTNGLATTDQLADTINALDFWENYTAPAQNP